MPPQRLALNRAPRSARKIKMDEREIIFSEEASEDFSDIMSHSWTMWGEEQARRYREKFDGAFANISRFPEMGKR